MGHSVGEYTETKAPTCTEDGEKTVECSVCGEDFTEVIPAMGHSTLNYETTKEPTCTEKGEAMAVCSNCDEEFSKEIPALGHSFGDWVVITEATIESEGEKERECTVCGDKETAVIAKLAPEEDKADDTDNNTNNNVSTEDVKNPEIPNTNSGEAVMVYVLFAGVACAFMSIIAIRRKYCK